MSMGGGCIVWTSKSSRGLWSQGVSNALYLEVIMDLSAPKQITFWVAVVLAVVGVLGYFVPSLGLGSFSFWLVVIGFVVLAAANLFEGL
jgi:threonine/homoserine/homoserine lactone efflux protein